MTHALPQHKIHKLCNAINLIAGKRTVKCSELILGDFTHVGVMVYTGSMHQKQWESNYSSMCLDRHYSAASILSFVEIRSVICSICSVR